MLHPEQVCFSHSRSYIVQGKDKRWRKKWSKSMAKLNNEQKVVSEHDDHNNARGTRSKMKG